MLRVYSGYPDGLLQPRSDCDRDGGSFDHCPLPGGITMTDGPVETSVHQVHRLSVDVGLSFDDFRARYEQAVPVLDAARLGEFTDWDSVLQVAADTPNGFFIYWQTDVAP